MHFILSEQDRPNGIEHDRPFCEDKHFTAVVHFRIGCKTLKNHFDNTLHFFPNFQTRTVTSSGNESSQKILMPCRR